jgi:hypothetical protein
VGARRQGALLSFVRQALDVAADIYEASSGEKEIFPYGDIEFRGTKGTLYSKEEGGYRIIPTRPGQFQTWSKLMDAEEFEPQSETLANGRRADNTYHLVHNFVECLKSRKMPFCSLEDGHRSTSFAHLANIALAVNQKLEWDSANERFINNEKANQLLHYEYRKPWSL